MALEKHISVKAAAEFYGYNIQHLRRLLRAGRLEGIKFGQEWLISLASLEAYLNHVKMVHDRRHGLRKIIADAGAGKTNCSKKEDDDICG